MMIYSFSLHPFVLITYPFKSLAITFPPPLIYFSLHLSLLLILPLFLPNSHTMTLSRIITISMTLFILPFFQFPLLLTPLLHLQLLIPYHYSQLSGFQLWFLIIYPIIPFPFHLLSTFLLIYGLYFPLFLFQLILFFQIILKFLILYLKYFILSYPKHNLPISQSSVSLP